MCCVISVPTHVGLSHFKYEKQGSIPCYSFLLRFSYENHRIYDAPTKLKSKVKHMQNYGSLHFSHSIIIIVDPFGARFDPSSKLTNYHAKLTTE